MDGQNSAAPVIIKRIKKVSGEGHHGGAWKVAYADFVTAMMAFFMLMWLLNATTEKQRKGISDYFSPAIPVTRVSGGGDGAFGGDSVFSQKQLAQSGAGASRLRPTAEHQAVGTSGGVNSTAARQQADRKFREIQTALKNLGGDSQSIDNAMRHVVTRVTDQGLTVEIFDLPDAPLFEGDSDQPTPVTRALVHMIAGVFSLVQNQVAVGGHVKSYTVVLKNNPSWSLSIARAQVVRNLLQGGHLPPDRMQRVTGFADRKPAVDNRSAPRNNRVELTLLRQQT